MKFFASKYNEYDSTVLCLFISNVISSNRTESLETLREEFGPWLFLGIREYSKTEFLHTFAEYIPSYVKQQLDAEKTIFTYKSQINTKALV